MLDRLLVDVEQHEIGRVGRPALGHDEDVVDLRHRVEDCDDRNEQEGGLELRQDDVAQPPIRSGAVEMRRLHHVLRHGLEAGEEEQHVVAGVLPDRDDHDGVERDVGIAEPVRQHRQQPADVIVEQADIRQEDEQEQRGGRDHRDQHRQEQCGPQSAVHGMGARQRQREQQCQPDARHRRADGVDQIVDDGAREGGVGEHRADVVEADEADRRLRRRALIERIDEHAAHRAIGEQREEDQRGQQQQIGRQRSLEAAREPLQKVQARCRRRRDRESRGFSEAHLIAPGN